MGVVGPNGVKRSESPGDLVFVSKLHEEGVGSAIGFAVERARGEGMRGAMIEIGDDLGHEPVRAGHTEAGFTSALVNRYLENL